jgi:hypothetical protein
MEGGDSRTPVFASRAISGGKIFIRGERNLYCIGQ